MDWVRLMRLLVQYQAVVDELVAELVETRTELAAASVRAGTLPVAPQPFDLAGLLGGIERSLLRDYWRATGHHLQQTSALLGLHERTCYRRLRGYGLNGGDGGHPGRSTP